MTEEVQETLPIETTPPPADPPAEPEVVAAEPELAPEPAPEPEPKKKPWFLDRISEENAGKRAAEQERDEWQRRARAAEELLQRGPTGDKAPPQRTIPDQIPDTSRQEEIRREAQRLRFQEDIGELNANGVRTYGADFDNAVNVLASVTGQNEPLFEFVADVMSVDKANAHALLHALGSKPEEAAIYARMTSKQRIAALTRMSMTSATEPKTALAPATKGISKAPVPAPTLQPTAHKTISFQSPESDKLTDKEFFAQLDEHMQKSGRHARR